MRYLEPGRKRRRRKLSLTPVLWFLAAAMVLALVAQARSAKTALAACAALSAIRRYAMTPRCMPKAKLAAISEL